MIQNHRCCSQTELQEYLHGWSSTDNDSIERHLQECSLCEEAFRQLESQNANDGLMDALRQRAQWTANGLEATEPTTNPSSEIELPIDEQPDSKVRQLLGEIQDWPVGQGLTPQPITPQHVGQYELLELIGQGGMAHVYRARHGKLQRTVAIKLLNVPSWQVDRSLARLEREIAVVGQLHHPAIVAATDAGQHEGTPYLVTEFIDGLNLSQLARAVPTGTSLKTADACQAIRVAALGLAHAHGQGITHRDIKPSNLMIDRQGQVKILDFGLVHLEGWQDEALELTTVGQLLGTLDYMAPEQADKATAVDHRSDVYALGATLFRLLCGRAPYAASLYQSPLEKLRLLAMTDPPKVTTLRPDLPTELAALIDQTLSRSPAHRPPSAAHLAEALLPFCEGAELGAWVQWAIENPPRPLPTETRGQWSIQRPVAELPEPKPVATESKGTGRSGRWWKRLLAAAGGAAALWLAIVLILDTQKGQLVIESESADVRVTLRKDGQESETLQLQPGLNQTRIFAGTYQIEVDGPADSYQMDRDTIVIKRGEVVLARVTKKPAAATASPAPAVAAADLVLPLDASKPVIPRSDNPTSVDGQPTYQGYPFSHWANIVHHEQDGEVRAKAFDNLKYFHASAEFLAQSRQLFLEAILQSHRQESPSMEPILAFAPTAYQLERDQWQQVAASLRALEPSPQVDRLRELGSFVKRLPLSDDRESLPNGLISYLELVSEIAAQQSHSWTLWQRHALWDNIVTIWTEVTKHVPNETKANSAILRDLQACLSSAVAPLDLSELISTGWIAFDHLEEQPLRRLLVIEALLDGVPTAEPSELEMAQWLAIVQRCAADLTEEQRQRLGQQLETWLAAANIETLTRPIGNLSRSANHVRLSPSGRLYESDDSRYEYPSPTLKCFSAPNEPHSGKLVVLSDSILTKNIVWPRRTDGRFTLTLHSPPCLGEMLISTWRQLQPGAKASDNQRLEGWLAETQSSYDSFWREILSQAASNAQLSYLYSDAESVWMTGDVSRASGRGRLGSRIPEDYTALRLSAWETSKVVESSWKVLRLSATESIGLTPERRFRVANPKFSGDVLIELTIGTTADLDSDGSVSKTEWFQYLSGREPLRKLEIISPEMTRAMLLHYYLLTVLNRPISEPEVLEVDKPVTEPTAVTVPANEPNQNMPESPTPPTTTDSTLPLADTALFRGQTYRHWFNVVKNDRDPKTRSDGFEILMRFKDKELVLQTKELMFEDLFSQPDQNVSHRRNNTTRGGFWLQAADRLLLDEDDWSRIEQSLENIPASEQAWYLQTISSRWLRQRTNEASTSEILRFLPIVKRIAEASASKWTSEAKVLLAESLGQATRRSELSETLQARSQVAPCLAALKMSGPDWVKLADSIRIESSEPLRELAIAALLIDKPEATVPSDVHFKYLVVWQRILLQASPESRTKISGELLPWLLTFNQDHWRSPWESTSKQSRQVARLRFDASPESTMLISAMGGGGSSGMIGSFSGLGSDASHQLLDDDAFRWDFSSIPIPQTGGEPLEVPFDSPPIFGTLLVNTVHLLLQDSPIQAATNLNHFLKATNDDYDHLIAQLSATSWDEKPGQIRISSSGLEIQQKRFGLDSNRVGTRTFDKVTAIGDLSIQQLRGAVLHLFVKSLLAESETPSKSETNE
ncbi:MAG: serine/threonine-protein kinase [Pirellulaceae bacterium]|nr:serine/threonine-protein kinase [Pirellulaceae bacterium]